MVKLGIPCLGVLAILAECARKSRAVFQTVREWAGIDLAAERRLASVDDGAGVADDMVVVALDGVPAL